jgi:hypothetical protein
MPRFNPRDLFKIFTPEDDSNRRREVIVKGLLRLEQVDEAAYKALMDMYETEIRGLFYQFLDPDMGPEKLMRNRDMALGILRLVQLVEIQKADFDKAKWLQDQEKQFKDDEERVLYAQRLSLTGKQE